MFAESHSDLIVGASDQETVIRLEIFTDRQVSDKHKTITDQEHSILTLTTNPRPWLGSSLDYQDNGGTACARTWAWT